MSDNRPYSARARLEEIAGTDGLSEDQADFYNALVNVEWLQNIREEALRTGEGMPDRVLTEDEVDKINSFSPQLDLIGTPREEELEGFIQSPRLFPAVKTPEQAAFTEGARAPGVLGDVLSGDIAGIVQRALQETQSTEDGQMSFDSFLKNVNRIRAERELQREAIKEQSPTAATLGEMAGDVAIAGGIGGTVATGLKAIPRVKAGMQAPGIEPLLGPAARGAAGSGVGTGAVEAIRDPGATPEEVFKAGLTGVVLDRALRLTGSGASAALKPTVKKLDEMAESTLNQAGEMAFRAIHGVKRQLIRAIERGADSRAAIGRILLRENIIPRFPPFFFDDKIGVRLEEALKTTGSELGRIRKRAINFNKKIMQHLDRHFEADDLPEDKMLQAVEDLNAFEQSLEIQIPELTDRLKLMIKDVPDVDTDSDLAKAAAAIRNKIAELKSRPNQSISIETALQWKKNVRKTLDQQGVATPGFHTQMMKKYEMVLADVTDQVISRNLILAKRLGNDFSLKNIEKVFGDIGAELQELADKAAAAGGVENLERVEKTELLRLFGENSAVQSLYRMLAKSRDLYAAKELANTTNNIISLRDTILGSTYGLEGGIVTATMSNILRRKGVATTSRALEALGNSVKHMKMVVGDTQLGLENLADHPQITPAIYTQLTNPSSEYNINGVMLLDDDFSLSRIIERISNNDDLSSVLKAKQINSILKNKQIKIFNDNFKKEGSEESIKEPDPGIEAISRDMERVMGTPSFEAELDVGRQ